MMRSISVLLTIPLFLECSPPNGRSQMDTLNLAVRWNLETNFAEGGGHNAQFTIRNNGDIQPIGRCIGIWHPGPSNRGA
jgi:hypothetical protein